MLHSAIVESSEGCLLIALFAYKSPQGYATCWILGAPAIARLCSVTNLKTHTLLKPMFTDPVDFYIRFLDWVMFLWWVIQKSFSLHADEKNNEEYLLIQCYYQFIENLHMLCCCLCFRIPVTLRPFSFVNHLAVTVETLQRNVPDGNCKQLSGYFRGKLLALCCF